MAADFNQPTVSGQYTAIPGQIRDNFSAAVTMHESDTSSNKPTGAKQITADGNINRWNGSAWVGIAGGVPSGAISAFAGSSAPTGWLLCNGATVSQTTYAALYAVIGHTYGADPGGGNFILPNLQNRVPVCKGSGTFASLAATGGTETHSLSEAELAGHTHSLSVSGTTSSNGSHSHGVTDSGHSHGSAGVNTGSLTGNIGGATPGTGFLENNLSTASATTGISINSDGAHTHTVTSTGTSGSAGSGNAHNNLQPYIVLNYIIKT